MKRILSILLLIATALCLLAGCSSNDPLYLPGTWYAQVDISENVNTVLENAFGTDMFAVKDMIVTMKLTLNSSGMYLMEVTNHSFSDAYENMMLQIEETLTKVLEDTIADEDMMLTVEEYLSMSDTTMEETMDDLSDSLDEYGFDDEIAHFTTSEASWYADETKLTFGATSFSYKLKGEKLTISGGNGDDAALLALPSPVTFSKTNPNEE